MLTLAIALPVHLPFHLLTWSPDFPCTQSHPPPPITFAPFPSQKVLWQKSLGMSRAQFCFYMWANLIPRPGCTSKSCGICQKYSFLYPRPTVLWKLSHVACPRQTSQCLCCRARLEKHRCRAPVLKRWCWMLVSDSPGDRFQNTCPLPQVILIHPPHPAWNCFFFKRP